MSVIDNSQGNEAEQALTQYGYKQEFRRELKRFASFAVGFFLYFYYHRYFYHISEVF